MTKPKRSKHIESISCGQGGPSLFLLVLAGELRQFPCDVVITADTGWENDMLWSDGRRSDAATFFREVTEPLANEYGIDAAFVRSEDRAGNPYLSIHEYIARHAPDGNLAKAQSIDIPLFGSNGGKLKQSCTSKWKVQGIRQELRRRGARTARTALGLTVEELQRMRHSELKWDRRAWPLIDYTGTRDRRTESMGLGRSWRRIEIEEQLSRRNIPYLVTSECDGCPHKDWPRWQRTSIETIGELAEFEKLFQGEYFLTRHLVSLPEAMAAMAAEDTGDLPMFAGADTCEPGYCFT